MDNLTDQPSTCAFMDALIDLLGQYPCRGSGVRGHGFAERLNGLEDEARRHAAPQETIAAICGVRVILDLAELPPLPALTNGRVVMSVAPAE